jgi:hypothetical protein
MGTNYYCETGRMLTVTCDCGFEHQLPEKLHIGKDSYGWKFTLHKIPEKGLYCYKAWEILLDKCTRIYDEYGDDVPLNEMKSIILKKNMEPITEERKKSMRVTAQKYGYVLDESCWLLSSGERVTGKDGNYSLMEGEFS